MAHMLQNIGADAVRFRGSSEEVTMNTGIALTY
jgi:hypothetical protein